LGGLSTNHTRPGWNGLEIPSTLARPTPKSFTLAQEIERLNAEAAQIEGRADQNARSGSASARSSKNCSPSPPTSSVFFLISFFLSFAQCHQLVSLGLRH
jgi:hypothetical protein